MAQARSASAIAARNQHAGDRLLLAGVVPASHRIPTLGSLLS